MKKQAQTGPERTGLQTLVCVVCGLVGLAAVVVSLLTTVFGNLFVVTLESGEALVVTYMPAISVGGVAYTQEPFSLFTMATTSEQWIPLMQVLVEGIMNTDMTIIMESLIPGSVALIVALVAVSLSSLIALIATIVAIIGFLKGLFSKKYFSLARPLAWVLGANVSIYLACVFGGVSAWVSPASAVFMNILLSALALGLTVIGNVLCAGKSALSLGGIMRFASSVCVFVGALICVLLFPMVITEGANTSMNEALMHFLTALFSLFQGGEFVEPTMPDFAYVAISFVMTIAFIFLLAGFLSKASNRLASSFSFNGKRKGLIFRSVLNIILLLVFIVPTVLYVGTIGETAAPEVFAILAGGIISLIGAILHKVFINK